MRRIRFLLAILAAILGLSGCMALNSADLLTLPEISPDHRELLKLINTVTASSDWSTTNPVAGSNKLTTQFVDIYQDGIPEAVAELQAAGIKMAIVSNKIDGAVQTLNDDFFHMDIAIGEREGIARKPAPDSVLLAMNELKADPARTVYVGDSDVDLNTAKNAGLPCISALWGFRTREELESYGAVCIADTPADMAAIILGKNT